jgi:hypothetical protein
MSTATTAPGLDSIDRAVDGVLPWQRPRVVPRGPAARPLPRAANVIAVAAIAPLVLAAFAALVLVLTAKLILVLVAARFEG